MTTSINIYLIVILSFILLILYSINSSKTLDNYTVANRNVKLIPLISTLVMTEINPMAIIAMAMMGYTYGTKALFMALIAFISPLFSTFATAKKWRLFEGNCMTLFLEQKYGKNVGFLARIIILPSLILLSATYIKGITIFSSIVVPEISVNFVRFVVLGFCTLSVIRSGLPGIIKMDIIGLVLTISSLLIILTALFKKGLILNFQNTNQILSAEYLYGLLILQCIMYSIAPWWGQKIFSAKNSHIAFKASFISSIIIGAIYFIIIITGCALRQQNVVLVDAEHSFPFIINSILPSYIVPFITIAFFLIATTTICGVWSSILTMITCGILKLPKNSNVFFNYMIWIIISITSYYIAHYHIDNVLNKAILAVVQICSIGIAIFAAMYYRRVTSLAAFASIIFSFIWGIFSFMFFGEENIYLWHWAKYGIPISTTICILISECQHFVYTMCHEKSKPEAKNPQ